MQKSCGIGSTIYLSYMFSYVMLSGVFRSSNAIYWRKREGEGEKEGGERGGGRKREGVREGERGVRDEGGGGRGKREEEGRRDICVSRL